MILECTSLRIFVPPFGRCDTILKLSDMHYFKAIIDYISFVLLKHPQQNLNIYTSILYEQVVKY